MEEHNPLQPRKRKLLRRPSWPRGKNLIVALVILGLVAAVAYLFWQRSEDQQRIQKLNNPQQASKTEAEELARKVGAKFELPGDETPSVATVVDAGKLKQQPFFAKSENGDKVLIYTKAKKAYLYRPGSDKIIEVATLDIKPTPAPSPKQ